MNLEQISKSAADCAASLLDSHLDGTKYVLVIYFPGEHGISTISNTQGKQAMEMLLAAQSSLEKM
jgi:hypothetical protein